MWKKPVQQRGMDKIDDILRCAEELLLELPIEDITSKMIADRAGVGRTSMYHFFKSKVDVYDALSDRYYQRLKEAIFAGFVSKSPTEYNKAWTNIASIYKQFFDDNPSAEVLLLGRKGARQVHFSNESTGLEFAKEVRDLISARTNYHDLVHEPPEPDFIQFVFSLMTGLFSMSVRKEGRITQETEEEVKTATIAYIQTRLDQNSGD